MGIPVVCSKKKIDILSLLLVVTVTLTIFKSRIPIIIIPHDFRNREVREVNPLESDAQERRAAHRG